VRGSSPRPFRSVPPAQRASAKFLAMVDRVAEELEQARYGLVWGIDRLNGRHEFLAVFLKPAGSPFEIFHG
jgi:hypothetical protein